ncbi:MAG TPA: 16S rRNA (cytosine(967)-C(5))-methyltransferase RsmB [Defluviitaleaceae bacterium]|jgi:16S rRNA (cytosine967-C5)-methyltransferase|nr:16S rRNA (cytosine(967)-C(5))-methyltransferase RsmB [Candidatus Epulonipiscium sp.]HOQ15911.1 16S rRNA (cytosine(967)-C(5))-methyltransferase RsmB [Defluviitaleaceae bacterium]HQD51030.1 16S rRNA (cytosine(967)-C(5))-methyltransferase RsmB [Defluviitaleaceae bacterium]
MEKLKPREIAVNIISEINEEGAYSNISLKDNLSYYGYLTDLDKAFITNIVNGTVRYLLTIDYVINSFSKIKTKKMKAIIRSILRASVYQILFMDKVPPSAACNEAVEITKKKGLSGLSAFVNGVLRNIVRHKDMISYPDPKKDFLNYLSVRYSFPQWILDYWLQYYEADFVEELCQASNINPPISIRCNLLKNDISSLAKSLLKEGVQVSQGLYLKEALYISKTSSLGDLESFNKGLFQVQDESSMLVGHILAPEKGERILDVCSAPGGKATHLGELMHNEGYILARDIHEKKLNLVADTAKRLGICIIETEEKDATELDEKLVNTMDKVLVDAPCSGLGIIRKKPDIKWKKENRDLESLINIQRKILEISSQYLKRNGVLVYSTCTISEKENLENIKWFIKNFDFELEDLNPYIPESIQNHDTKKGYIQLYPHIHNTDGFFIARLRKK